MRQCSICKRLMQSGWINENDGTYFCTIKCRNTKYTQKEYNDVYDDGNGGFFWITWIETNKNLVILSDFLMRLQKENRLTPNVIKAFVEIATEVD